MLTQDGKIFLNGTAINLQGVQTLSGDALMINWNCGVAEDSAGGTERRQQQTAGYAAVLSDITAATGLYVKEK